MSDLGYKNPGYDMDGMVGDQPSTDFLSVNPVSDGLGMTAYGAGKNLYDSFQGEDVDIVKASAATMELGAQAVGWITDPLGALISNGLDFLIAVIQPLEDILGFVTGNPDRLQNAIDRWNTIEQACYALAQEVQHVSGAGLGEWDDQAAAIAKTRISELADAIGGIGVKSATCQHWLSVAQALAQTLQEVIKSIISSFLSQLITTWLAALAAAAVTFGGSTAAAASWTAVMSARNVMQATRALAQGKNISAMLQASIKTVTTDLAKAGEVLTKIKTITPIATATANNQATRSRDNHSRAGDGGSEYDGQGFSDISGTIHS
ncbi:hypothetical protein K3N28_22030 [Glycomyces sp. TRM65418]|uniref:hypothetical protein n=1 Tax=Glycomyces sp. TRM65418 TaxID=2867006 RepID=UPI001CE6D265|nr:hypothetical protein [Glycomyces sp. TRM65418]MCC3765742.1 hypothetical protein [Glycomyces sp. TRM65418]QZD55333.1 hypothetical protein K3N28_21910 [Glycomyces sp. TRM65418]